MKFKSVRIYFFILICIIAIISAVLVFTYYEYISEMSDNTFTVASWNLQVFGDKKASDKDVLEYYASIIKNFDVVFLQEIRDKDGSSFKELCNKLPEYSCILSSRAGRSNSKEQYGVVYVNNTNISLNFFNITLFDYNPDPLDRWERPPIKISVFFNNNYSLILYNIHTKPSDVYSELLYLEKIINNTGNIVVLGDLNADCYYYNVSNKEVFLSGWKWLIKDSDDTTAGRSNCAYDRIIINENAMKEYMSHGILRTNYSDHYLIWIKFNIFENNKTFNDYLRYVLSEK